MKKILKRVIPVTVMNGSFSIYDVEAGNPGIEGILELISDAELVLHVEKTVDTDIPPVWEDMEMEQSSTYRFTDEGKLEIAYVREDTCSTLVFHR